MFKWRLRKRSSLPEITFRANVSFVPRLRTRSWRYELRVRAYCGEVYGNMRPAGGAATTLSWTYPVQAHIFC